MAIDPQFPLPSVFVCGLSAASVVRDWVRACERSMVVDPGCSSRLLARSLALVCRSEGFDDKTKADKDQPQSPIEVYEWSIWVGNPAQTTINASRIYRNAMPNVVGTSRPKFEEQGAGRQVPDRADLGRASSSASHAATSTSTSGRRKGPSSPTGRRARSTPAGSSGSSRT